MAWSDQLILDWLTSLAIWVLLNGVDDLFIDCTRLYFGIRGSFRRRLVDPSLEREPRIALLIPCWNEADVIEQMIERNLGAVEYQNYDIWLGLYPNDPDSIERVRRCAARHPRVHMAIGPDPGPTTKADCLNHAVNKILLHEQQTGDHYEVFLQHDAEDLLDPQSVNLVARWTRRHDMVQIPVFPLATPIADFTHGIYCDDFADMHQREMPVRWRLGGFVPSAGVGTALRREALDQLRISFGREVFDPRSLTEDYFLGLRLQRLGFTQAFVLEAGRDGGPIATRAYFPRTAMAATRQRTRWTIGNVLQSWERFGWWSGGRYSLRNCYWLWRDRKGLVNHAASLATNIALAVGLAGWAKAAWSGSSWDLGAAIAQNAVLTALLAANAVLLIERQGVRMWWASRIYGWGFACLAPLRAVWANAINAVAVLRALAIFFHAKWRGRPLHWSKTQHLYPVAPVLTPRVEPAAAALISLDAARRLGIVPIRLDGETLESASLLRPSLAIERDVSRVLGRPVRILQVSESEFSALRREFENMPRRRAAAANM